MPTESLPKRDAHEVGVARSLVQESSEIRRDRTYQRLQLLQLEGVVDRNCEVQLVAAVGVLPNQVFAGVRQYVLRRRRGGASLNAHALGRAHIEEEEFVGLATGAALLHQRACVCVAARCQGVAGDAVGSALADEDARRLDEAGVRGELHADGDDVVAVEAAVLQVVVEQRTHFPGDGWPR